MSKFSAFKVSVRKRSGFSRLETLVLGGVGALSCLVLWPALAQIAPQTAADNDGKPLTDEQMSMRCMSNLKQLSLGAMQYVQDYDEKYPLFSVRTAQTTDDDPAPVGWADSIQPYIKNTGILQCPAETHGSSMKRVKEGPRMIADAAQMSGFTDYWYNAILTQLDMTALESPWKTILFGDGNGGSINSNARYTLDSMPNSWVKNLSSPVHRHRDGQFAAYAFTDGHVKMLPPEKVTNKPPSKLEGGEATFEEGVTGVPILEPGAEMRAPAEPAVALRR